MSRLEMLKPHTGLRVLKAPSAPGLWLAFGTWRGGGSDWPRPIIPHSAGKGATADQAVRSCLGEMAEHLSIGAWAHDPARLRAVSLTGVPVDFDPRTALVHDLDDPNDPGSEGVAAGETLEEAIEAALCERLERMARRLWWANAESARPIAEDWLRESGVRAYEASLRGSMAARWKTEYFLIGDGLPRETVLVVTDAPEGRSLGTAAALDAADAARAALNEAILEEVPLLTGAGKQNGELGAEERAARERSRSLSKRANDRHEDCWPVAGDESLSDRPFGDLRIVDLTHPLVGVPVVRVLVSGTRRQDRQQL